MLKLFFAFMDDQSGSGHLEYALMLALVTMGVLGSMETMGASVSDWFFAASDQLGGAVNGDDCRRFALCAPGSQ
jgi:Flp pilus assembly pilin Flp